MVNERFLVIGSNSFSGASFVAAALRQGAEVVGVSRSSEANPVYLPYRWGRYEKFTFHQMDLNHDLDRIDSLMQQVQPQYVINFSAQGMVAQSWQKPEDWFQTNTLSMIRLHERLRHLPGLVKFVHASTPEVYGNTSGVINESAPFNPSTPYAVSKAACDMNLLAHQRAYGLPVAMTRAANVCGPGQALYRIIPKTMLCILTERKLRLEGGGLSQRSFIHIDDTSEAVLLIARQAKPGSIYHLSTDQRVTIRGLVERICQRMGADFDKCVEVVPGRLGQDSAYLLDSGRAKADLGWTPRRSLDDIIDTTLAWMRKHLDVLRKEPDTYVHKA